MAFNSSKIAACFEMDYQDRKRCDNNTTVNLDGDFMDI